MEKFALLNLLKALETLSPKQNSEKTPDSAQQPAPNPAPAENVTFPEIPNVMASVIERHEAIANRVKSKHSN